MRRGRKLGLAVLTSLVTVGVMTGGAYGVLALTDGTLVTRDDAIDAPPRAVATTPPPVVATSPAVAAATRAVRPDPGPRLVLERRDSGVRVRELQHRLYQLAWYRPQTTGYYGKGTRTAVERFQKKRRLEVTGEVDARTWRRLVRMTRMPTRDEMFNRAGPTLFGPGDAGSEVREIQARLRQIGWYFGDVSNEYGAATTEAVAGFQGKRRIPVTGKVDRRTLDLLEGMTYQPTADELANRPPDPADGARLDPRCLTGRALCIDKSSSSLRWVVDGKVLSTMDVRFGASYTPTREGEFQVYWKDPDHVSKLYGSAMPFSMFFSSGQAVHYSSDFAARGYAGASHGCVNVRDYDALAAVYSQVSVGDKVIVYWS